MLAGIAVEEKERKEIQKAHCPGDAESPPPAEMHHGERHQRNADDVGEFRRGIEDGCGKRPFLTWKPVARRLGASGKTWSLGDTQQNARTEDRAESARARGRGGTERPEERADTIDAGDAEAIKDHSSRNLQQRVGPEEAAKEPAQLAVGQTEFEL